MATTIPPRAEPGTTIPTPPAAIFTKARAGAQQRWKDCYHHWCCWSCFRITLISTTIDGSYIRGSGSGCETALAFGATGGAKRVVLIGRAGSMLAGTKDVLEATSDGVLYLIFPADITDDKAMHQIAAEVGTWDVFILNAGHIPDPGPNASTNLSDYWSTYETNVISVIIAATAFLPIANKTHVTMLGLTAGALVFSPAGTLSLSAYLTSKMAMVKTLEFLATEDQSIFVVSGYLGMVDTGIFRKLGAKPETLPVDTGELTNVPLVIFIECLDCVS